MKFFRDSLLAACAVGICLTAIDLKAEKYSQNAPPSIQKPGRKTKMIIRRAADADVEAMAELAEKKRIQYEKYQPVFHHRAEGAREMHGRFLGNLIKREEVIVLVAGEPGKVEGFIYAKMEGVPPVYNPGGKVCGVDDFMVSEPKLWATTGKMLLEGVMQEAEKQGAVLGNVVCGPLDAEKVAMLQSMGYSVASQWFVKPLKK